MEYSELKHENAMMYARMEMERAKNRRLKPLWASYGACFALALVLLSLYLF
jgi:hypothetical protein